MGEEPSYRHGMVNIVEDEDMTKYDEQFKNLLELL